MILSPKLQLFLGILIGALFAIPVLYFSNLLPQITPPLSTQVKATGNIRPFNSSSVKVLSESTSPKQVVGFYPYWNLDKVNDVDLSQLTTLYYFALDLNADGSFNKTDPGWSRLSSPDYQTLKQKILHTPTHLGLTIINLDPNSIAQNINSQAHQQKIITNTLQEMTSGNFQDLNIDLEYSGTPDSALTQQFTGFVQKLTSAVHESIPGSIVTIDTYANSVAKPKIFDIKSLGQIVDGIVIMAYDINRLDSLRTGPISPLFGNGKYAYDVTTSVNDYLSIVPPEKILLGVPFYGYEWPTLDNTPNSFVVNSSHGPEISSYSRSLTTAKDHSASLIFDDESKSVWFSYFEQSSHTWRQVWFENERSLGVKFDLVNDLKLGGIAIFALGYDGKDAGPLWHEVKLKLK